MSATPVLTVLEAFVARLKADDDVSEEVGVRVYDQPPDDPTYPFVSIGQMAVTQADTDGSGGVTLRVSVEAYSRPSSGRVECQRILDAVRESLHRSEGALQSTYPTIYSVEYVQELITLSTDGETHAGVGVFDVRIDQGLY